MTISLTDLYLNVRESERHLINLNFASKAARATRHWNLGDEDRAILDGLLGVHADVGSYCLSNARLRAASSRTLVDALQAYWPSSVEPGTPGYFFTFTCEVGFASDRGTVIRLGAFRRMMGQALRHVGLSAIGQLEIQAIVNFPQKGLGRTLILHAHVIAWGEVPIGAIKRAVDELNATDGWANPLGAAPVLFRELEGGMFEVLQLAYYLDKLPISGKNRIELRKKPGEFRFRNTMRGYRDELALRLMEVLSQISLFEAVISSGEGIAVRRAWKRMLLERTPALFEADPEYLEDVHSFWSAVRAENGSRHFAPVLIER